MRKPIYDNRTLLGFARSLDHAKKIIRQTVHVNHRARLHVWDRDTDLIDLPAGFVFAISWGPK
jgi:hypothetical protein